MVGHTPSGSVIDTLPGSLPVAELPRNVDADAVALSLIPKLESLSVSDFTNQALWRDIYALTGTSRTFSSPSVIGSAWNDVCAVHNPTAFSLIPGASRAVRVTSQCSWIEARFAFRTKGNPALSCSGFVSAVPDAGGEWKIWLLRTVLEGIEGLPDVDSLQPQSQRAPSVEDGQKDRDEFDCVVVGGGPAGLCAAGRLQALGVSYVVLDSNPQVGDSWMRRYDSVKLHTVRNYAQLPFERSFTPDYPELLSKYDVAKAYKQWVDKYGINTWLSTTLESGSWNQHRQSWVLQISRDGRKSSVTTKHLVLAVGVGGQTPTMPTLPGRDKFSGLVLHSSDYKSSSQWKGKAGVIIGSGCTAHDISEDMVESELSSVTMVQRGTTAVIAADQYHKITSALFNDTTPIETADRIQFSNPIALGRLNLNRQLHAMVRADPGRWDALQKTGFKAERYADVVYHLHERLGGFYLDVGASAKICQGLIKVKSDATPTAFNEHGLVFDDGSTVPADVVIFATGFVGKIRPTIGRLLGQSVANQVDEYWGIDGEGELRGVFKPTGHPGLWYAGGTLGHVRFLSRFLAMQIQAQLQGTPLPVYGRKNESSMSAPVANL